jgi:hypothetical protein
MPKQSQTRGQPRRQSLPKSELDIVTRRAREQATFTESSDYIGLPSDSSIHTHTNLLNDDRFLTVQRQGIASQIGRIAGNQYLQRAVASMEQSVREAPHSIPPSKAYLLQRKDDDEISARQNLMIPLELQTSVDVSSLSDEELRRRSELILVTLGQFHQKTPITQRLEDELVRIAIEVSKRPSDVGERIVENYEASARKTPGGACYVVALARVKQAYHDILGEDLTKSLPKGKTKSAFNRLWGSHIRPKRVWLKLPEAYRGKGAAGAMAYAGKGTIAEQTQIWSGALLPGAVLQTWAVAEDFENVKEGKKPESYGHSFIFLRYKRKDNKPDGDIEGMEIADQGFQSQGVLNESDYGYWVAANVTGNLPYARGEGDEGLIRFLLSGKNKIKGGESKATNFNLRGGKKFKLDASKIVAEIKKAAIGFKDENIKKAINSLNPDRFNVYFTQIVALYQLGLSTGVDGRFGDGTCKKLVGKRRKRAQSLKKE